LLEHHQHAYQCGSGEQLCYHVYVMEERLANVFSSSSEVVCRGVGVNVRVDVLASGIKVQLLVAFDLLPSPLSKAVGLDCCHNLRGGHYVGREAGWDCEHDRADMREQGCHQGCCGGQGQCGCMCGYVVQM
jgi:hypothetical protein